MQTRIVIIGAGPGGYVAAIRAAQLGARVTVVDAQVLGGVCLNWGCIPSKTLLAAVELGEKMKRAHEYGVKLSGPVCYDLAAMVARKDRVVQTLVRGIGSLFKSWAIEQVNGTGELIDERTVRVTRPDGTESRLEADGIVLATGSSWPNTSFCPVDGRQVITSKEALDLTERPDSLIILGGGVEGCEFASLYRGLGTRVTVIEMMPRLLPAEDQEISSFIERELRRQGVSVLCGTTLESVERQAGSVQLTLRDGSRLQATMLLVSVGRRLNSRGLNLEKVGVATGHRGEILVDQRMQTNVPGVYAVGDVVGQVMLAHVASAQGKTAVENILGHSREIRSDVIPAGIFTLPEIGRVGMTEEQAQEGHRLSIGRFRYQGLGKAQAVGETGGFFKIIADEPSGRLLGVHIIGSHASDLIHEAALALQLGARAADMASMIHAHPTLAEGLLEAAEDVEQLAIHLARKRGELRDRPREPRVS